MRDINGEFSVWYDEEKDEVVEVKIFDDQAYGTRETRYDFDEYLEECTDDNYRDLLESLPLHIKIEKEMDYDFDVLKEAYLKLYYSCKEKGVIVDAVYDADMDADKDAELERLKKSKAEYDADMEAQDSSMGKGKVSDED